MHMLNKLLSPFIYLFIVEFTIIFFKKMFFKLCERREWETTSVKGPGLAHHIVGPQAHKKPKAIVSCKKQRLKSQIGLLSIG